MWCAIKSYSRSGLSLVVLGLTLLLAAAAGAQPPDPASGGGVALSSEPVAGPRLEAALDDTSATVRGGHFRLHWSVASGGDLTSIQIHDGTGWREILGRGRIRHSMPGLRIVADGGDYRPLGAGSMRWLEQSDERVVLAVETVPSTTDGRRSAFRVRQLFTVYAAGAVFIDLEIELPTGASPVELERASIGWPVATDEFELQRWYWRRNPDHGAYLQEPTRTFRASPCLNLGLALGRQDEFTNQLQFALEDDRIVGGAPTSVGTLVSEGNYFIFHLRPAAVGSVTLSAPFSYRNRCALFLGHRPDRDALHGQRLVYWREGGESSMAYPSPSALEAMVECGASGVILGPGWRRAAGRYGNQPVDAAAMATMIDVAHGLGLRVLAYVLADGDPDELGRWAQALRLDGLYVDQTSPHLGLLGDGKNQYAARAAFEWAYRLRRKLGPESLLIGHAGVPGPDLSMALVLPGVVYGLHRGESRVTAEPLRAAYLGGEGYGVPCPLAEEFRLRSTQSLAVYAADGAVPLVPLGNGAERSAYQGARWVLPLWQIYRSLPMGNAVVANGGRGLVVSQNPGFRANLYQYSADVALVVTSNMSRAKVDTTTLEVDYAALGFAGGYAVEEIRSLALEELESIYLGRSSDGLIHTEPIERWGVRGYLFVRGDYPPVVGRALDELGQLARAFVDQRPPAAPAAPTVTAGNLSLVVDWEPVNDRHHVEAYHVYRSAAEQFDPAALDDLGLVYEITSFRDADVEPGTRWYYAVVAVDQAGNRGNPSPATAGQLPVPKLLLAFGDASDGDRLEPLSGSWSSYEGAFEHGRIADATRFARAMLRDSDYRDVDLRVRIDSPGGYRYAGGLIFRATDAGDGYVLFLGEPQYSRLVLGEVTGSQVRRIAEADYPYVNAEGCVRTLRVVADGARIVASCDDRVLIDVEDTSCNGRRLGLTALQGHVRFDNLSIRRPGDDD